MMIRIKFFAVVKDLAGRGEALLQVPEGATVAVAVEQIAAAWPGVREHLGKSAFAVNLSYAPADTVLRDGDELAVIPPVSGGCDAHPKS